MSQDLGDGVVGNAEEATNEDLKILEQDAGVSVDGGSADDNEDDGDDGDDRGTKVDSEMDNAADESEREAIRARRREERKRRKANRNDKVESLERMVETLAHQNRVAQEALARLQSSDASAKLGQLDGAIEESKQHYGYFQKAYADAITKQDGSTAAIALERMNQARDRFTQLTSVRESVVNSARQPSPIDPTVKNAAVEFANKHKWYKGPAATDLDSAIMTKLDHAVSQEGYDPRTPAYWAELESRAKKYIPHRFDGASQSAKNGDNDGEGQSRRPRSPVAGSASQRGNDGSNGEGEFRLSADRVKAMKEAGIWDDPARRKKMIDTYKKMDRANS